jgi:hypothetical protein
LKHPIIQKRIDYFKHHTEEPEDQALLQTIRIPKNLLFLSDKLPQPNYEKAIVPQGKKNQSFQNKKELAEGVKQIKKKNLEMEDAEGANASMSKKHKIAKGTPNTNNANNNANNEAERNKSPKQRRNENSRGNSRSLEIIQNEDSGTTHINKKVLNYNDLPQIGNNPVNGAKKSHQEGGDVYTKKVKEIYEKNPKMHGGGKVYSNNDHINNIYKIYAPYMKNSPVKYKNYSVEKSKNNPSSLKKLEKYYDYYSYKGGNANIKEGKITIVPNRKLSPLRKI